MNKLSSYLANLQRFGIKPGLERIESLLKQVGEPQLQYPHLLVGGTNGKGSTCEFIARLLAHDNRRIGLYTSPHLYSWNERIRILPGDGLFEGAISDDDLDELFEAALPYIDVVTKELGQPTEFEVITFLGLWHFARQKVDAVVLEVGLGGRWDATNVTDPLISAVTHVALDHMDRLGNTLEEIAADKVCIARPNRPFLTLESKPNVLEVFENYCETIEAKFEPIKPIGVNDFNNTNFDFAQKISARFSDLLGWKLGEQPYFPLQIRGRYETIGSNPRVIIDGANNPEGAEVLIEQLKHDENLRGNIILVLGILADKDWAQMTKLLVENAKIVICTSSDSPRALPAETLAKEALNHNPHTELVHGIANAVARAKELTTKNDTILITGSFTTIAEVPRGL
jgi:dihydrofolate synthase/folylpolyglutamate synthase